MLLLKYMFGAFDHASRNQRELDAASEAGFKILVNDTQPRSHVDVIHGFSVLGGSRRTRTNPWIRKLQTISWLLIREPLRIRSIQAQVISCQDLLAVFVCWLASSTVHRSARPLLVYDAHEFTVGQHEGWRRSLVRLLEGFLIRRCTFTIVVNNAIADRVQSIHRLKQRPIVVRSTPANWPIDEAAIEKQRAQFLLELDMSEDAFITMYHGGVLPHRGIETLIRVLQDQPEVALVVLGDAQDPDYLDSLRRLAADLSVHQRVVFKESVDIADLCNYVGASDVGMVTVLPVTESYRLMLPNKFFENIQALTPVIVSDFPEISGIVRDYALGFAVDPQSVNAIGKAIDDLRTNQELRDHLQVNLRRAKSEFTWQNEKHALVEAYRTIFQSILLKDASVGQDR